MKLPEEWSDTELNQKITFNVSIYIAINAAYPNNFFPGKETNIPCKPRAVV